MEFTNDSYIKIERESADIFRKVGWGVEMVTNYERIDKIIERAYTETIIRDSSTFIFRGFAEAINGFSSAFFGSAIKGQDDYRA